jgi:hypothetical protein
MPVVDRAFEIGTPEVRGFEVSAAELRRLPESVLQTI